MTPSKPDISIKETPVGRGVFATKTIRKNQVIGQMKGNIVFDDNYDPCYVVALDKGVLEPKAPFRFLNHCCEPNATLVEWEPERKNAHPTIWVEALKTIKPGEQITIDYAWPAEKDALKCGCGSPRCRGWVVDKGELKKLHKLINIPRPETRRTQKLTSSKKTRRRAG